MMRPNINYYALLGVTSTATPEEITRAYRKKILEVHLDKLPQNEDSDICYTTIEAYRVLSDRNLRAKYDIQRDASYKASEVFIPAGYICYDVGQNQMSKRVLQSIIEWKKEFAEVQASSAITGGFSDNYFETFSTLMKQVIDSDGNPNTNSRNPSVSTDDDDYFCPICDKKFQTESHHWEEVVYPYVTMFTCDKSGIGPLYMYFETLLGPEYFSWEPRYLPTRLLGIWGCEEWDNLSLCDTQVSQILEELPSEDDFESVSDQVAYIRETFLSDSETDPEIYPPLACELICWVLLHQDNQDDVVNKVNDHLTRDEITEVMYITSIMKNLLECAQEEWTELASDALHSNLLELAMLWTKVGIEFGELEQSQWFDLGMKIHKDDPVLAHFSFLSGGYQSDEHWSTLADHFTLQKKHFASLEYLLNKGKLASVLEKSKKLLKTDPEGASVYRKVYYSTRIKSLLSTLQNRKREDSSVYDEELEEIIELIEDLDDLNPLEGYRLIANTWPKAFEESPGHAIHQGTIDFLQRSDMTIKSFSLILAAMHLIPTEDIDEELLTSECIKLTLRQMNKSLKSSDFEGLTEILLFLNKRALPAATEILEEMEAQENITGVNNTQSHLKAMKLLIQGTVNKVEKKWMEAMTDYQNALLCSPECMHRVLPCISKLSQDIEFHEAVVTEVQSEVKELKELFDSEEYPQVETYNSNRNSLVISDVAPKMDYGYKNSIAKIQPDPDQLANQPPPQEPLETPVETNTPMVTLDKNEEAIESGQGGPLAQLNAALAYVDLLKALPLPFQPGPIVMAASHFLRAMDDTKEPGDLFAYRNAITLMAENLLKIDQKTQATIQHCLTHKHMLSILLSAHEKLSKALADLAQPEESSTSSSSSSEEDSDSDSDSSSSSSEKVKLGRKPKSKPKPKTSTSTAEGGVNLIKRSDSTLISKFLKNVVSFPKIEPLANIPTLNCSDLVYVETLGNSFLSQFCAEKVRQKYQSRKIPRHLHAYTHFVEVWKGRSQLTDFDTARQNAIEELLALKGWDPTDVEDLMNFSLLNLTDDGWSSEYRTELQFPQPSNAYRSIHGFKLDYTSGKISFLLTKDKQSAFTSGNLFDIYDIREIFSNSIEKSSLSLDPPDPALRSHPFKEAKFHPQTAQENVPNYFKSLSRVALLLCYFCSGLEICAKSPFYMKPTDEGLLHRLEEHLQHLLRPIKTRKEEHPERSAKSLNPDLEIPNKLWLTMTEVFEEIEEDDEGSFITYKVGDVKSLVKVNTLVMTLNGTKSHLSPEAEFARDFSRNFDEIGQYFPELLRLKELLKISVICTKLKEILIEKHLTMKQNGMSKEEITKIKNVCKTIEGLGISIHDEEERNSKKGPKYPAGVGGDGECRWFPASFCNNMEPGEVYELSAGVKMSPEITYGPVSVPSDAVFLSENELFKSKKPLFARKS